MASTPPAAEVCDESELEIVSPDPSLAQVARLTSPTSIASQLRLSLANYRGAASAASSSRRSLESSQPEDRYVLGIAAMPKKIHNKAFQSVLSSLLAEARKDGVTVAVVEFTPDVLFEQDVSQWPVVNCLIAFFSSGFPLEKAIAYTELNPHVFQVNDLRMQLVLKDRLHTYNHLRELGVPLARFAAAMRSTPGGPSDPPVRQVGDYLFVGDKKFVKPFVEKPVDADDHDVWIYYPQSQGGGVRQLFRKQDDQSSAFSQRTTIRTDRSYIYEEFLMTERLDCKVYAVGPSYALCQQRKAPTTDGCVERTEEGLERRRESRLSPTEQHIARRIVQGFRQNVCGFDMLRAPRNTFVCDVNGWSSVKNNPNYWNTAGRLIHRMCTRAVFHWSDDSRTSSRNPSRSSSRSSSRASSPQRPSDSASSASSASSPSANSGRTSDLYSRFSLTREADTNSELLGIACVFRHADRTPKQKVKYHTSDAELLPYVSSGKAFKKKNSSADNVHALSVTLADQIDRVRQRLADSKTGSSDDKNAANANKLSLVVSVLRQNRAGTKVQIKPVACKSAASNHNNNNNNNDNDDNDDDAMRPPRRALLIVKWGGILTDAGIDQATMAGRQFFDRVAPELPPNARTQWTQRLAGHVYSNEERRVHLTAVHLVGALVEHECCRSPEELELATSQFQQNAAPSGSGFLLLREDSQPQLNTLQQLKDDTTARVACRPRLLDGVDAAAPLIAKAKAKVSESAHAFRLPEEFEVLMPSDEDLQHTMRAFPVTKPTGPESPASQQTLWQNRFQQLLFLIENQMLTFISHLEELVDRRGADQPVYAGETLGEMVCRWQQLSQTFYEFAKNKFDVTKVPTCYDYTKYDSLHNRGLSDETAAILRDMAHTTSWLASLVVQCEYGVTRSEKLQIGSLIAQPLLQHIVHQSLRMFRSPSPASRLALYFTSESHMVALMNLLVCSPEIDSDFCVRGELNYLSCICFKLYEIRDRNSLSTFYIDIFISTGAEHDIFGTLPSPSQHVLPISPSLFVQRVPLINLCTVAVPYSVLYDQ